MKINPLSIIEASEALNLLQSSTGLDTIIAGSTYNTLLFHDIKHEDSYIKFDDHIIYFL